MEMVDCDCKNPRYSDAWCYGRFSGLGCHTRGRLWDMGEDGEPFRIPQDWELICQNCGTVHAKKKQMGYKPRKIVMWGDCPTCGAESRERRWFRIEGGKYPSKMIDAFDSDRCMDCEEAENCGFPKRFDCPEFKEWEKQQEEIAKQALFEIEKNL